jgi:5'-nucleotidase
VKPTHRSLATATAVLLGAPLLAVTPAQAADDVTLNLIGINDFHGRIDANTVKFAGTVEQVRQQAPDNSLLISAGDNVSASLFASAVQGDIPTIDVLNALHLDASAAGNHEFDKGAADLTGRLSDAADFPFLAPTCSRLTTRRCSRSTSSSRSTASTSRSWEP